MQVKVGISSGIITAKTSLYSVKTEKTLSPIKSFESSLKSLSFETFFKRSLFLKIAVLVFSILNESVDENLTARIMRSASSLKRTSAFPTALITLFSISFFPPNKSTISFLLGLNAIALTVKSRRDKSSSILLTNFTFSG